MKKRYELVDYIKEIALDYSIVEVTNLQIDNTNILIERLKSYHDVLDKLNMPLKNFIFSDLN